MILFNYYNEDGYISQITKYITNSMDDMGLNFRIAFREQVFDAYEKYKPDILLVYHPPYDFEKYIGILDKMPCHKVLWESETPFEIDVVRKAIKIFYYAFVMDKSSANFLQKENDQIKIFHVPCAFYPQVHKKYEVDYRYRSDLVFVGAPFTSRVDFFRDNLDFLSDYFVTVIGYGWKGRIDFPLNFRIINDILSDQECMKYYSGAKVALNLHRQNSDSWGYNENDVKPSSPANRLFEIAGTKTPQIVDSSREPEIYDYFPEGLTVFKNHEDFREKFKELISSPELRKEKAKLVYKRAIKEHTYKNRLQKYFIDILRK